MTIETTYRQGDKLYINGTEQTIKGIHLYVCEDGHITERYYIGKQNWLTINRKTEVR